MQLLHFLPQFRGRGSCIIDLGRQLSDVVLELSLLLSSVFAISETVCKIDPPAKIAEITVEWDSASFRSPQAGGE